MSKKGKYLNQLTQIIQDNKDFSKNVNVHLKNYNSDIIRIMDLFKSLNIWSNILQGEDYSLLISEIFMDNYASVHFSLSALYKYADMPLRSALETSLNLIYFYNHPIEFKWWKDGEELYPLEKGQHLGVTGYDYFLRLGNEFSPSGSKQLIDDLRNQYGALSKSTHSSSKHFQTTPIRLAPLVEISRFKSWTLRIRSCFSLINSFFILGFHDEYQKLSIDDKKSIQSILLKNHIKILNMMNLL